MAIKAFEEQLLNEYRQNKINIIDKKNSFKTDKLDKIENIKFVENSKFFQCGICMNSFNDGEQLKKLS